MQRPIRETLKYVTENNPVLCPKCKKSVLGIGRSFGGRKTLVTVEVHHHEDAKRFAAGAQTRVCTFKMNWKDSQELANSVSSDLGGRK